MFMFLLTGHVGDLVKTLPDEEQSNLRHWQNNLLPRGPEETLGLGLRLTQLQSYQQKLGITEPLQRLGLRFLVTRRMLPSQHR